MEIYDFLLQSVAEKFTKVKSLQETPRSQVWLLRHNDTGKRYVFRNYEGDAAVYRALMQVSCPVIPEVYEAAEKSGRSAVLEEYIPGETISAMLEGALFTPREVRRILSQLCEGLQMLHGMGIVHRDIKPENVILRDSGPVLLDFDAARTYKVSGTGDTHVLGTTGYAAPEQYGISQTDCRSDIYSLGVLMNVMLTGQHPSTRLAKGALGRVVTRCTMMTPENRFQTVAHLLRAL